MDSIGDRMEQPDGSAAGDLGPTDAPDSRLQPRFVAGAADPVRSASTVIVDDGPPTSLGKWLAIYTLLRLGMLVLLAGVLSLLMPLILALLFAVVLALPLAWLLFGGVRRRVNQALAASNAVRRAERERLRSALNGEDLR